MSDQRLFLGVDGGGTKTEFLCIDGGGEMVASVTTGTTYHLQIGFDAAVARLREGIESVCQQAGITPGALGYAFIGLPAYGEDAEIDPQLEAACGTLLGHDRYRCGNDMVCGWAGSLACQDGINIVAGTGSIGYGERQGLAARVGGWGEIFSDEGSAHWIAVQGLNAFSRMSDGRIARGPLHRCFVEELKLSHDLDLCARVMGPQGLGRSEIAGLAPIVLRAAEEGDDVAAQILERAARELVALAVALRTSLLYPSEEKCLLSWSGGVLKNNPNILSVFESLIELRGDFEIVAPIYSPAYGAALYAAKIAQARNNNR